MDSDAPEPGDLSTLARPRFRLTDASTDFVLTVVEGAQLGEALRIDGTQPRAAHIGSGPACELRVHDRQVSRRHASLEPAGARLRLTDLASTNGTFVDGVAIVEALLRGGETVRIGSTALEVTRSQAPARPRLSTRTSFGPIVGASTEMRRLYPLCERLAQSDVTVVIEGETGTGKEVLAEALHEEGPRANRPFVVFDCTAVPANLVESELFGHERGAFTGAITARKGLFEQAHGGTLLIDEIGDLELALQPKLLRAIERSEIRRLGGDRTIRVDVRLLAATRRDLDREVQAGRFRDDLFHRLMVARIELPPLRHRVGDVQILAQHFWAALGGDPAQLSGDLLLRWEDDEWRGNVRELRNAVARRLAVGDLAQLPNVGHSSSAAAGVTATSDDVVGAILREELPLIDARQKMIAEFERRYIEDLLRRHGGSVSRAAAASGLAKRHFQRIKARGLEG
jgi:transcriptional regulator with GAF, ATPase, and Fis domain